ncbi:hypothetical protein V1477_015825 [Vespula maculifrons]|uniref:Secreted protein n=1 Tax=Vespula maculifrons TaxID=7453 RepID=A0ABD2BB94_VESMC
MRRGIWPVRVTTACPTCPINVFLRRGHRGPAGAAATAAAATVTAMAAAGRSLPTEFRSHKEAERKA